MSPAPRPRLLYLGFLVPPQTEAKFPLTNPAGQRFEKAFLRGLSRFFDIRQVTLLARGMAMEAPGPESWWEGWQGLSESGPTFFHQWQLLGRLRQHWNRLCRAGWRPEVVVCYNLTPIYNAFLRSLATAGYAPRRVCLMTDSTWLGRRMPLGKRLRYALKPFQVPDASMISRLDAVIAVSHATVRRLEGDGKPCLWMPGGCDLAAVLPIRIAEHSGPIVFGYYGALGDHAGAEELILAHQRSAGDAVLRVCGYGKKTPVLRELTARDPRQELHPLPATPHASVAFGNTCDVLVNPRPASHGNENTLPSKIFSYVESGAAILSTTLGGVDALLGETAAYADAARLVESLSGQISVLSQAGREALRDRAECCRRRVLRDYTWEEQTRRAAEFVLERLRPSI
jgi:glycosyltransferase involved in cell wall biosynthesis